jgi:hypothetical protein
MGGGSASVVLLLACLSLDLRFAGSNPPEDGGFLMAIKRSTTSFGGEVKPSAPCIILRHFKGPYSTERELVG